jgi:hypothetical protein
VSVSLASIVSLSCGATEFSPASLFTSGVVGAWYDPSDYSSLFQDSAGTTPVTAVEQPVGLMLDKSQGLATTAAPIDGNMNTATWTKASAWTAPSARSIVCDGTQTGNADTLASFVKSASTIVKWTFNITAISGTLSVYATGGTPNIFTTTGTKTVYSDTASNFNIFRMSTAGHTCTITDITIQVIAGNHASQATSASRPVLRARYNLLTYSEQFDNAAWSKSSCSITPNQEVAPDGTTTVDLLQFSAQFGRLQQGSLTSGVVYTFSIWCRVASGTRVYSLYDSLGNSIGSFTATTTLTRYSVTFTAPATATLYAVQDRNAAPFVDTYIWGADLRTGSSAGTYQRIAAATDYDTAGFAPYLALITDDSLSTGSIDFSSGDNMAVCVGLQNAAANGMVVELSADATSNAGTFYLYNNNSSTRYDFLSRGSLGGGVSSYTYTAPDVAVLTGTGKISTNSNVLRRNGVQVGTASNAQGTGNYGNYPMYIGRRNNASLPFEGRIYGLIVAGKTLSASELASTEAWMNGKTGAY